MFALVRRSVSKTSSSVLRLSYRHKSRDIIEINEEVAVAIQNGNPVVALESSHLTHGIPFPENIKSGIEVSKAVRDKGAVPATIAILDGKIKVGLEPKDLEALGNIAYSNPVKTSRRDFSYVVGRRRNGGTTVAGTLVVANKVGIPILATGGVGGVHYGGEFSFDISADLEEMARSNVTVVSSGVKSILDIPKTLEYLETQGVPVATFGDSLDFPAFFSAKSGYQAPYLVRNAAEAAKIMLANLVIGLNSGLLIAVPVPAEYSFDSKEISVTINNALKIAKEKGIHGKNITPFLLKEVAKLTKGKSLITNIALVKNNASVAADIAVQFSHLKKATGMRLAPQEQVPIAAGLDNARVAMTLPIGVKRPVLVGGTNLDCYAKLHTSRLTLDGGLYTVAYTYGPGGVARNMCAAMDKFGCSPFFITVVGDDAAGKTLVDTIPPVCRGGINVIKGVSSGQCHILLYDNGDCPVIFGDMGIHMRITDKVIERYNKEISTCPIIIIDSNINPSAVKKLMEIGNKHQIPVFFEPTDTSVCHRAFEGINWKHNLSYITPNLNELKRIVNFLNPKYEIDKISNKFEDIAKLGSELAHFIDYVVVTLGDKGVLMITKRAATDPLLTKPETKKRMNDPVLTRHYPVKAIKSPNVSGAGDCFASGMLHAMIKGLSEEICISVGMESAKRSLQVKDAVPEVMFDDEHPCWQQAAKYVKIA